MKEKYIKLIIICSIFITMILSIVGFTYAIFKLQVQGNENASSIITNLGSLELTFTDGDYISAPNFMPPWTDTKTITITNTGTHTISYYLIWETLTNTFVNKNLLTYTITNAGAGSTLSQRSIPPSGENVPILPQTSIAVGVTHTYTITFNYENSSTINQSLDMRKIFRGKLKVVEEVPLWSDSCTAGSNLLNCSILEDNPEYATQAVVNDTMFASTATTDMGLWTENRVGKTEDDLPVYFYRGDIANNYVSFAGKMWRIVRINEDGSVKLILGGNSATDGYGGETKYNTGNTLPEQIDYTHLNNVLRVANEEWYTNDTKGNLDEYESYIADTKFCNDKSVASTSGSDIYYSSRTRIAINKTPQYKCPNASDNLIYKIGALTADEVVYAGLLYDNANSLNYLYDNVKNSGYTGYWWLLSPYRYYDSVVYALDVVGSSNPGYLTFHSVNSTFNFRPVVSLKSNTIISTGDGNFVSPYVIP